MVDAKKEADFNEELLTAQEVAAILRVQPSTVFAAAATGRLPVLRIWRGRRKSLLRFRRADIENMIKPSVPPTVQDAFSPEVRRRGRRP